MQQTTTVNKLSVREIAVTGMFIALTLAATAFINIRLPFAGNGGLIHLGNVPLFIGAVLFGKRTGFLAGALGMGLFDLLSGWTLWAPFTFVVVGCMGFIIGKATEKKKDTLHVIIGLILACIIKVAGYYIAEGIIYGNWIVPIGSIPGNLVQIGVAAVITIAVLPVLKKVFRIY